MTVLGLGIEGVDVARYAATHGAAAVTVYDDKPAASLAPRIAQLQGLQVDIRAGGARVDLSSTDVVFASQSVPLSHPAIATAIEHGIPVSSMARAFLEHCPGPVIGITGSSGKTTTTSLVAHAFATAGRPHRLGGNIGIGLLGLLEGFDEQTWAVLEISHAQLQLIDRSPHIAAVLNVTPNHLDAFTWDEYVALKQKMVRFQSADDFAVLNLDNEISAACAELTPAQVAHFSLERQPRGDGSFVRDGAVFLRRGNIEEMVLAVAEIPLRGTHNVANVLAASIIASLAGIDTPAIADAVRSFQPVAHRLELVAEIDGVRYVNDSIASTPERTVAGVRSFNEPLVLLLGGKDKNLPKEELAEEALRRCSGIVFFGQDGALLEAAVEAASAHVAHENRPQTVRVASLDEAVRAAAQIAEPGDVVLLSPACTSFDAYANFEERGERFRQLVRSLSGEAR